MKKEGIPQKMYSGKTHLCLICDCDLLLRPFCIPRGTDELQHANFWNLFRGSTLFWNGSPQPESIGTSAVASGLVFLTNMPNTSTTILHMCKKTCLLRQQEDMLPANKKTCPLVQHVLLNKTTCLLHKATRPHVGPEDMSSLSATRPVCLLNKQTCLLAQ